MALLYLTLYNVHLMIQVKAMMVTCVGAGRNQILMGRLIGDLKRQSKEEYAKFLDGEVMEERLTFF